MIELLVYLVFVRWRRSKYAVPAMFVAPAVVGVTLLYLYPLLWELNVSFTKMSIRNFFMPGILGLTAEKNIFVAFQNYGLVFTGRVLNDVGFFQLLAIGNYVWLDVNLDGIQGDPAVSLFVSGPPCMGRQRQGMASATAPPVARRSNASASWLRALL